MCRGCRLKLHLASKAFTGCMGGLDNTKVLIALKKKLVVFDSALQKAKIKK
jgi:hypothetical protein